jgi:hypothetical protein
MTPISFKIFLINNPPRSGAMLADMVHPLFHRERPDGNTAVSNHFQALIVIRQSKLQVPGRKKFALEIRHATKVSGEGILMARALCKEPEEST